MGDKLAILLVLLATTPIGALAQERSAEDVKTTSKPSKDTPSSKPQTSQKRVRNGTAAPPSVTAQKHEAARNNAPVLLTPDSKVGQSATGKDNLVTEQPDPAKTATESEEEKIVEAIDFLMLLELLKDYELISDDK